jgi:peptidoglycan/xylan/chitin deacetylase (PgdA/CDA1 family)
MVEIYRADASWRAKIRRRAVRMAARKRARTPERPMVSFAFDDVAASAAELGASILERRGLKGSFFVSAGLVGSESPTGQIADTPAIQRLGEAGHEVGCHTYSHLDCARARVADVVADVARNAETLMGWGLPRPATFAFPYGDVALGAKRALAPRFTLMRAVHPGLITAGSDLNQAPAVNIDGPEGKATALRWLERATARRAWLIFFTHDVVETPSPWGCTPGAFQRLIDAAQLAEFEVVTVAEGARRLGPSPRAVH